MENERRMEYGLEIHAAALRSSQLGGAESVSSPPVVLLMVVVRWRTAPSL
jgi:hypothetical protein